MGEGMIQNRESFLNNIASQLKRDRIKQVDHPVWSYRPQWEVFKDYSADELVDALEVQCKKIHTDFVKTNTEDLSNDLQKVIEGYGGKKVVYSKDPRFESFQASKLLKETMPEAGMDVLEWNTKDALTCREFAERADVGISVSDMTLAESGTVTLLSGNDHGRLISLLPTSYIAIIPKSTIVPRITQAAHYIHNQIKDGNEVTSCVSFITGPSNSADIEMNLIVGVHGPVHVTYIVVQDQ